MNSQDHILNCAHNIPSSACHHPRPGHYPTCTCYIECTVYTQYVRRSKTKIQVLYKRAAARPRGRLHVTFENRRRSYGQEELGARATHRVSRCTCWSPAQSRSTLPRFLPSPSAFSHMRRRRTGFGPRGVPSPLSSDRRCCGVGAADDEDENGEP